MKEVLRITQSSRITATSPSDCLISYPRHWLGGGSYSSGEKQSVYSTAPADWSLKEDISWKVNKIVQREFELAHYDAVV